jgi:hypothetical protein
MAIRRLTPRLSRNSRPASIFGPASTKRYARQPNDGRGCDGHGMIETTMPATSPHIRAFLALSVSSVLAACAGSPQPGPEAKAPSAYQTSQSFAATTASWPSASLYAADVGVEIASRG